MKQKIKRLNGWQAPTHVPLWHTILIFFLCFLCFSCVCSFPSILMQQRSERLKGWQGPHMFLLWHGVPVFFTSFFGFFLCFSLLFFSNDEAGEWETEGVAGSASRFFCVTLFICSCLFLACLCSCSGRVTVDHERYKPYLLRWIQRPVIKCI